MVLQVDFCDAAIPYVLGIKHTETGKMFARVVQLYQNVAIIFITMVTSFVAQARDKCWFTNNTF